jgi:hypothetical protein
MLVSLTAFFNRLVDEMLRQFRDEYQLWGLTGAKKLLDLKLQGIYDASN